MEVAIEKIIQPACGFYFKGISTVFQFKRQKKPMLSISISPRFRGLFLSCFHCVSNVFQIPQDHATPF